ncbi:MAG: fibronectin type III domain-containing protein [Akkermansiaceae bacterium]|nr:fibronectin type III domain-containing protein [Akkermansiaceae bacterium]
MLTFNLFRKYFLPTLPILTLLAGLPSAASAQVATEPPTMVATWAANPETDIQSYIVHFGKDPEALSHQANAGNTTSFEFTDLEPGAVYYCAIVAVNTSGMKSGMSALVPFWSPSGGFFEGADEWLMTFGFEPGSPMAVDHNSDGVTLLTSYALNLNPLDRPLASMPKARVVGDKLQMRFFAGRDDVSYRVEASADLRNWSDANVSLSPRDNLLYRTASIVLGGNERFLRLVVSR